MATFVKIHCPNRAFKEIVLKYLFDKGFTFWEVGNTIEKVLDSQNTRIVVYFDDKTIGSDNLNDKVISFEDLVARIESPYFIEVKLNNNFTAKVYSNKVTIGCWTLDWNAVAKIWNAHSKIVSGD